jgi:hypothetical protein
LQREKIRRPSRFWQTRHRARCIQLW